MEKQQFMNCKLHLNIKCAALINYIYLYEWMILASLPLLPSLRQASNCSLEKKCLDDAPQIVRRRAKQKLARHFYSYTLSESVVVLGMCSDKHSLDLVVEGQHEGTTSTSEDVGQASLEEGLSTLITVDLSEAVHGASVHLL